MKWLAKFPKKTFDSADSALQIGKSLLKSVKIFSRAEMMSKIFFGSFLISLMRASKL